MRKRTILILDHVEIELMENILRVDESRSGSATIVSLSGRMDASSSPAAEAVLSRLIGAGERRIVVDMSDLDYISSAGLRVMLASLKRLREDGGQLLLAGLKPEIKNIFEIAGFQRIFSIYPSPEDAVSSFDARV
ncbi:MAG: STAS domain-containing protein [Methanoregulaceae archaeon]|jgi:anti-sigma B factor antagonist|nr:STAS domain-containing protein [Methanoregulaceae archaeon]